MQDAIAELTSMSLVDRMESVHIADNCVQVVFLVDMVKAADVSVEVFFVQQPRQLIALGIAYQLAVLGQLYAFVDACLDDLDIRIRLRNEIHCSDLQAIKLGFLVDR